MALFPAGVERSFTPSNTKAVHERGAASSFGVSPGSDGSASSRANEARNFPRCSALRRFSQRSRHTPVDDDRVQGHDHEIDGDVFGRRGQLDGDPGDEGDQLEHKDGSDDEPVVAPPVSRPVPHKALRDAVRAMRPVGRAAAVKRRSRPGCPGGVS